MRTFNGLQIFTEQLTNSGQLDLRYVTLHSTQTVSGTKTFNNIIYNPNYRPSAPNSPGFSGQIAFNRDWIFICVSGNGVQGDWRATPLGTNWSLN